MGRKPKDDITIYEEKFGKKVVDWGEDDFFEYMDFYSDPTRNIVFRKQRTVNEIRYAAGIKRFSTNAQEMLERMKKEEVLQKNVTHEEFISLLNTLRKMLDDKRMGIRDIILIELVWYGVNKTMIPSLLDIDVSISRVPMISNKDVLICDDGRFTHIIDDENLVKDVKFYRSGCKHYMNSGIVADYLESPYFIKVTQMGSGSPEVKEFLGKNVSDGRVASYTRIIAKTMMYLCKSKYYDEVKSIADRCQNVGDFRRSGALYGLYRANVLKQLAVDDVWQMFDIDEYAKQFYLKMSSLIYDYQI